MEGANDESLEDFNTEKRRRKTGLQLRLSYPGANTNCWPKTWSLLVHAAFQIGTHPEDGGRNLCGKVGSHTPIHAALYTRRYDLTELSIP